MGYFLTLSVGGHCFCEAVAHWAWARQCAEIGMDTRAGGDLYLGCHAVGMNWGLTSFDPRHPAFGLTDQRADVRRSPVRGKVALETSLHRQLKALYAEDGTQVEVPVAGYRIDVVRGEELVEIQHGSLAAIRRKVDRLLAAHHVRVVKPIVVRKTLVKFDRPGGRVLSRRKSPKRGSLLDLFDELVYFTGVFPHKRLTLEIALVDIDEWRCPGHGRRRRWRANDFRVLDRQLLEVHETRRFREAADLRALMPARMPRRFHTGHLAERLGVERWVAQRIAYCMRHAGTVRAVGKQGNAVVYEYAALNDECLITSR